MSAPRYNLQLEMQFHDFVCKPEWDGALFNSQTFKSGRVRLRSVSVASSTIESPDYNHDEVKARLVKALREELVNTDTLEVMIGAMLRQAEAHCASHPKKSDKCPSVW